MFRFSNSLRLRSLQDTLSLEPYYVDKFGISEIRDITGLDNIGIPVYASYRPHAAKGSLSVNYGKGFKKDEAKASAFMEALEYALSEKKYNGIEVEKVRVQNILDGTERKDAILDFCPILGAEFLADNLIDAVWTKDVLSGKEFYVPAELVLIPHYAGIKQFGNSSNGLCSGNSLEEAAIHGIIELIERDITSKQIIKTDVSVVDPGSFTDNAKVLDEMITEAGHELIVYYGHNEYAIPYFEAIIIDKDLKAGVEVKIGYGCHPLKEIALMRAITEAAQDRIGTLHHPMKEQTETYGLFPELQEGDRMIQKKKISFELKGNLPNINFRKIMECHWSAKGLGDFLESIYEMLKRHTFGYIFIIPFSSPDEKLQVVKVIIPKMEYYNVHTNRVGPRLASFTETFTNSSVK